MMAYLVSCQYLQDLNSTLHRKDDKKAILEPTLKGRRFQGSVNMYAYLLSWKYIMPHLGISLLGNMVFISVMYQP